MPQLLKPVHLEPVLRNKRSHHNEKPECSNGDPTQPKINKLKKYIKLPFKKIIKKRFSTSFVTREMQIETTVRHHFIPIRMTVII